MEVISLIFNQLLVRPIINVLLVIYNGLLFVHVPFALGFSIIILTIVIRFITYPLISSQLKTSKKMQEIAPHLSRLKEKHKNDASRLQQETMKLYKEFGVNPVAGCLPSLIQLPVIWGLYNVLQQVVGLAPNKIVAHINSLVYIPSLGLTKPWDQHFFGLPLGQNPAHLFNSLPLILLVPILTGVFQLIQSKMMLGKVAAKQDKKIVVKNGSKDASEDFAATFQKQSTYIFPVMIGFFSYNFPLGLSLYWNTFTIFGILQQYKVSGLGGLSDWTQKIWTPKKKK